MVLLGAFLDKINVKSEENAMKNRVKELRDAKHLTQTGLALKVGSTQQTISKIEQIKVTMGWELVSLKKLR